MTKKNTFRSVIPPTPAETAVAAATWERRGVLRRLVRIDHDVPAPEDRHRAPRRSRPRAAPASPSV